MERQVTIKWGLTGAMQIYSEQPPYLFFVHFHNPYIRGKEASIHPSKNLLGSGERNTGWYDITWGRACKCKEVGGLTQKNIRGFNLTLLSKWQWRLSIEEGEMWSTVIRQ